MFAIEHHVCEQVQRQEQGLGCARLAHGEGRRANAHANEERKRVLPDGIVPSNAHLLVELVDNETSDVVLGFSELFTIWSCKEHVCACAFGTAAADCSKEGRVGIQIGMYEALRPVDVVEKSSGPALQKSNHHRKRNPNHQVTEHLKREEDPSLRLSQWAATHRQSRQSMNSLEQSGLRLLPSAKNAEDNGDNFARCNLGHRTSRCTHCRRVAHPPVVAGRTFRTMGIATGSVPLRVTHTGAVKRITGTSVTITRHRKRATTNRARGRGT